MEDISREEVLALISKLTQVVANADEQQLSKRADAGSIRDPLVRTLAAIALRDLHDKQGLSYREIAAMFGTSHSRVHQLHQELVEKSILPVEDKKAASA